MAAPRPKKKTVKKAKAPAKDDGFGRFKKMYQGGEVKMLANPPPLPGAGGGVLGVVAKVGSKAAKDLRSTNPKSLRNKALREANRVAKQNKPKYKEKIGPNRPHGPEAPKYLEKIGPNRPAPSASTTSSTGSKLVKYGAGGLAAGLMIGGGIGYLTSASDKKAPKYRKPAPGANYSGQEKKIPRKPAPGSNYSGPAKSTYSGYGNFNPPKVQSSASSTAATSAAASGSSGGSQAANVANAGGKAKAKVGRQTRYQRNELAMEQRKRSSSKPKKSIFSLFRKG